MANNKIFVKVTQTLNQLGGRNVVTSGNVQLVSRGPGTSVITAADQSAVIEFFDESDKTNAIMTITGTVKLDGGGPKFNLNAATRNSNVGRTDFSLPLTFDQNTFDGSQFATSFTLILPWRIIKHGNVEGFRIGAQMKIAGTLEGPAFGDVLDLPLKHDQVDDDVEQVKDTCLGIGTVYATNNRFLSGNQTIPQGGGIQIILQEGVRARFDALSGQPAVNPATFTSSIQSNLATILGTGGLRNITVTEQTMAQTATDWKLNTADGFTYSTKCADPDHPMQGEGNTLDFFQFFFFPSSGLNAVGGDTLGMAEDINEFTNGRIGIDFAKKKKLVLRAGRLLMAGMSSPMKAALAGCATPDDQIRLLSNLIAHEVGHALGLRHSFAVTASAYNPVPATGGLMGSSSTTATIQLDALGPIHERVLKQLFP